ncbi:MAG: cytochrome P450 [Pseudomonadota bacterium]
MTKGGSEPDAGLPIFRQSPREPGFVQDPWPAYERLRALGPAAHWQDLPDIKAVFSGRDEVDALLRDRRFGREPPTRPAPAPHLTAFEAFSHASLLEREPPTHTRLRRLVNRAFTSRGIADLAPRIEALADRLLDAMPDEVDLIQAYAEPIPLTVIAEMLGAPVDAGPRLLAWSHDMVAVYQARRDRAVEDRAEAATRDFADFMGDLIAARRRRPGEAMLDALIAARDGEDRLSEEELVATAMLLLNAGHEATVHAIANAVWRVLTLDLPRDLFDGPGAEIAVEEMLRHAPPLHLFTRFALEPAKVGGVAFETGDVVGLLLAGAGRDPAVFAAAERLDPGRAEAGRHVAFGAGLHFCVGAPLARMEMRIALSRLFARRPGLRLAAPPRVADRWHFHGLEALPVSG